METRLIRLIILFILPISLISCNEERGKICNFDLGEGEFEEPFRGFLSSKPEILVKSLDYPPFSWLMSDTVVLSKQIEISFNEEAVRSKSTATIAICSNSYKPFDQVMVYCNDTLLIDNTYLTTATIEPKILDLKIKIHPDFGEQIAEGFIMVNGNNIDEVNGHSLKDGLHPVEKLAFSQRIGWPLWIWILWILIALLIIAIIIFIIYLIVKFIKALFSGLGNMTTKQRVKSKNIKKAKSKKQEKEDPYIKIAKEIERQIYNSSTVKEKYDYFEKLRLHINSTAETNPDLNERCYQAMMAMTQKALDERNEKLWSKTPISGGSWSSKRGMSTFILYQSSTAYMNTKQFDMTKCKYDIHGSPDFTSVTSPNSIVDVSDLYDKYSISELDKRGGGWNSFQEVAQRRMADRMTNKIHSWWQNNHPGESFDKYDAFYKWRDANDLVPHEDTNCKTMRLVKRPVHEVFKHCGGISNAKIIKSYFF
ncbi:MAG: hypothetical protein J6T63_00780 [Bacteroidales bacterium]|nr:hypothetical protein [Bacteroidales bacterium]